MSRDCYPPFSDNDSLKISSSQRRRYIPDDNHDGSANDSTRSSHMHLNSYDEQYYYHQPQDKWLPHPSFATSSHPSTSTQDQLRPLNFANEKYASVSNNAERRLNSSAGFEDTNLRQSHSELKNLLLNSRSMENGNSNRNIIVRSNNNSMVPNSTIAKNEKKISTNDAFSPSNYKKSYAFSDARQNDAYNSNTEHRGVINNKLSVIKTAPKSLPENKPIFESISNDKKVGESFCDVKLSTEASGNYKFSTDGSGKSTLSTGMSGDSKFYTEESGKLPVSTSGSSRFSTKGSGKLALSTEASGKSSLSRESSEKSKFSIEVCGKSSVSTEISGNSKSSTRGNEKSALSTEASGKFSLSRELSEEKSQFSIEGNAELALFTDASGKSKLSTEVNSRSVITNCNSTSEQRVTKNESNHCAFPPSNQYEDCNSKTNNNDYFNSVEQNNSAKSSNDSIEMVENKLAEMFAGLEDSVDLNTPKVPLRLARLNEVTSEEEAEEEYSKPKQKLLQKKIQHKKRGPKKKPPKVLKKKGVAKGKMKSTVYKNKDPHVISKEADVVRTRVPILRVEGPKENPTNVSIINGKPDECENSEKPSASYKKFAKLSKRENHYGSLAESINFGSKLELDSNSPWECIFCMCGPHQPGIAGDPSGPLYGPYYMKNVENSDRKRITPHASRRSETLKRKASNRSQSREDDTAELYCEIWAHENCFVWASGIYMIGTSLMGLEETVKVATETMCDYCQKSGASIGCQRRKCLKKSHFSCALNKEWHLDRKSFKTFCNDHKCA